MPERSLPSPAQRVLLVGWDGADWKIASRLIDAGELPQLANIVTHGASGPLSSLPPYLSPILWNSIATGKYADQHGILGFTTVDPATGKMIPVTSTQRRCKALWNILSEHGLATHVLGWFASHPAENVTGVCVSEAFPRPVAPGAPWPVPAGSVHPATLEERFGALRLRPEEVHPGLPRLLPPRATEAAQSKDKRLAQLAIRLAELYSVHNAAIAALKREPGVFLGVYYHFIDWVCHDFMDFHPPRRTQIPEREFEWYKDVVNSAYRLQDLLLRDLLAHAGPHTTVVLCSDHGFHSDARRPQRVPVVSAGIAIWHRAQGIFAAAGPGVARDVLVNGATLLDITPTILRLLGLPPAADMDGRVLRDALAPGVAPLPPIPSYENDPGPQPRARQVAALTHAEQAALLEQFAALGYVDLTDASAESAATRSERDNRWNLALTLRHAGKHEAAFALLETLHLERPEDARYAYHLAMCQLHLGLNEEAAATTETIADFTPGSHQAHLLLAEFALLRGRPDEALVQLDAAARASPPAAPVTLLLPRGQAWLKLGRLSEACATLREAVEADDENPSAWLSYAQALMRADQAAEAEACAREAVALAPMMAMAHFTLGQALTAQAAKQAEARAAFARAEDLNPRLQAATRARARLEGKPFVADLPDLSAPTAADADLRATSRRRRAEFTERRANQRAQTTPVMRYAPPKPSAPPPPAAVPPIVVVSGLPRSGTSLMMQMLARGGLPPLTDGRRVADVDNPEGYFEWEDIKNLPHRPELIAQAAGRAVKIVSPLLPHLPGHHRYKLIFMTRPAEEIARSQEKMRRRLASDNASTLAPDAPGMQPLLAQHAEATLAALRRLPHLELLTVDFPTLIANPAGEAQRVTEFLGTGLLPQADAMASAVRPLLYRERRQNA